MMYRSLSVAFLALAMCAFATAVKAADAKADADTHQGTVVSASAGRLVMNDANGKEHSHDVGADVKITIDGKSSKLEDLKKGEKITVTTQNGKVTAITAVGNATTK